MARSGLCSAASATRRGNASEARNLQHVHGGNGWPGYTEVGDRRFEWATNDIVVMPNFLWRRHVNKGKTDAVLYTVVDAS